MSKWPLSDSVDIFPKAVSFRAMEHQSIAPSGQHLSQHGATTARPHAWRVRHLLPDSGKAHLLHPADSQRALDMALARLIPRPDSNLATLLTAETIDLSTQVHG
jgi:hypothetical protein